MTAPALTITIPTFQRESKLLARVRELLFQMGPEDRLLVVDNATPGFAPERHPELGDPRVRVIVNSANIGGNANIAGCLGLPSTNWMWLLSDDDPVLPEAIDTIRSEIARFPEACFISFIARNAPQVRTQSIACEGLAAFVAHDDGFENTLLISNCVFQLSRLLPYLAFAHRAIWTNGQHLAPALKALEAGASAVYSAQSLIDWAAPDPQAGWSLVSLYHILRLPTILEDGVQARLLRRRIAAALPPPEKFVAQLCYMRVRHGDDWRMRAHARQVLSDMLEGRGLAGLVRRLALCAMLTFPRPAMAGIILAYRVLKKQDAARLLQDRRFSLYI